MIDAQAGAERADASRSLDAADARHADVEHHRVGLQALGQLDGLEAVRGDADDVEAVVGEHVREHGAHGIVVVGDEDTDQRQATARRPLRRRRERATECSPRCACRVLAR